MKLAMLVWLSAAAHGATLTLSSSGKQVKALEPAALTKITPPTQIEVWEPHESKKVTYRGYPMNAILDGVYGQSWKSREEILFTCADGYQPSIPVDRFLKETAYLVFERVGTSFEITNQLQGNEHVTLAPYYLVWDNSKVEDKSSLSAHGWPYQLTHLDLVSFKERFPQMAPPKGSSQTVQKGFLAFREHCAQCHSVNGDGGLKGIELNYPVSVTEYFKRKWLKQWILDPTKMRMKTSMPALSHRLPDRLKITDQIVAYLESMAKVKVAPKEAP